MSISFFTDFVGKFQFKDGVFESYSMNEDNLSVDPKASSSQTCKGHEDLIITRFRVMIKIDKRRASQLGVVLAEFLHKSNGKWVSTRASAKLSAMNCLLFRG